MQLRNQLNRRNVASNPDGRFNASVDFIELVTESHILAAGMNFGLKETSGSPTYNRIPSKAMKATLEMQWSVLSTTVGQLIDHYVIVRFSDLAPKTRVPIGLVLILYSQHWSKILMLPGCYQNMLMFAKYCNTHHCSEKEKLTPVAQVTR